MSASGRVLKMVAVGDGFVGKTTLLITHTTGVFEGDYVPTVFENYAGTMMVDDAEYSYTLWDTAGQEGFDQCRVLCYSETNVFLVCFAINSPTSFENVKNIWLPEIRRECGQKISAVLVGTKSDLRSSTPSERVVKKADGKKLARALKMHGYVETSAKLQEGCTEAFEEAIRATVKPPRSVCVVL
ncbi:ras-related protein ced-10-like [Portunus trituberculatus]|uniref:ras-related protein ced-10-like n=1 Tax=Portunus trituberculatus TaxID=210409 RepID=UPI001E1D0DD3|nr:ras-related protein ced-10-like [Portunus trituberculatus]